MPTEVSPGWIRVIIPFVLSGAGLSGTGALNIINALGLDTRLRLEKLVLITMDTLAGAGGSQTFKLRKGSVTGTVVATAILTLASHATQGTVFETVIADSEDNKQNDTDTISLTRDASGTAFSGGLVQGYVVARQRSQRRI